MNVMEMTHLVQLGIFLMDLPVEICTTISRRTSD